MIESTPFPTFELIGKVTSSHLNEDGTTTITGIELSSLSLSQEASPLDIGHAAITVDELSTIADQPRGQREDENRRLFRGSNDGR